MSRTPKRPPRWLPTQGGVYIPDEDKPRHAGYRDPKPDTNPGIELPIDSGPIEITEDPHVNGKGNDPNV